MDHGNKDIFALNENMFLTASRLHSYLEDIRSNTGCNSFIIIIDACYSGSFIDDLSAKGSIIITSASCNQVAFFPGWSAFSTPFWANIASKVSIGSAFNMASRQLGDLFKLFQTPLLDDNGDYVGHPANVPNNGDGELAMATYIGLSIPTGLTPQPYIASLIPCKQALYGSKINIWCKVKSYTKIVNVTAIVMSPWISSISEDMRELQRIYLADDDKDGNYAGVFSATMLGDNTVIIFAIDENGNVAVKKTLIKVVDQRLHQIRIEDKHFDILFESNSTIFNISLDVEDRKLVFNVEGPDSTFGFCNLTIPKSLMRGPWQIEIDGNPLTTFIHYENSTHSFIRVEYAHTIHQISIIATWIIPEFQLHLLLLGFLILLTITIAFEKRTKRKIS